MKTGVEDGMFWSEIGSGFGEPGGTPPPRIPRSNPPPPPPTPGFQQTSTHHTGFFFCVRNDINYGGLLRCSC